MTDIRENLVDRYKEVPSKIKYALILKDLTRMYGKEFAENQIRHMYEDSETFIFSFENALAELSKTVKKNVINKTVENDIAICHYIRLEESGRLKELYPNSTGIWKDDKAEIIKSYWEQHGNWIYLID